MVCRREVFKESGNVEQDGEVRLEWVVTIVVLNVVREAEMAWV